MGGQRFNQTRREMNGWMDVSVWMNGYTVRWLHGWATQSEMPIKRSQAEMICSMKGVDLTAKKTKGKYDKTHTRHEQLGKLPLADCNPKGTTQQNLKVTTIYSIDRIDNNTNILMFYPS